MIGQKAWTVSKPPMVDHDVVQNVSVPIEGDQLTRQIHHSNCNRKSVEVRIQTIREICRWDPVGRAPTTPLQSKKRDIALHDAVQQYRGRLADIYCNRSNMDRGLRVSETTALRPPSPQ